MSFGDQVDKYLRDKGSMEYLVWKHKQHAPRDAAERMVVRPDLQKFYSSMIPSQRQLLQDKMAAKVDQLTKEIQQKYNRVKTNMDSNKVFHPNANAQRVHTLQLAELQRRLDIQKIEDETLEDMFNAQTDESIREEEKSVVASILKGTPFNAFGMTASATSKSSKQKSNEEQLMGLSRNSHATPMSLGKTAKGSAASLIGRKLFGGTPPIVLSKKDRDKNDNPISAEARKAEAKRWAKAPELHGGRGEDRRFVADFEFFQNSGVSAASVAARAKAAGNTTLVKQLVNDEPGFKDYMRVHLANNKDGKQKQFTGASNSSKRGLPPLPKTPAVQMMLSQKVSGERPPVGEFIHSRGTDGGSSFISHEGLTFENSFLSPSATDGPTWSDTKQHDQDPSGGEDEGLHFSQDPDFGATEQQFGVGFPEQLSESAASEDGEVEKADHASMNSRNHNSENTSTAGLESLHPRLQEVWFTLEYSMQAKLEFLQKYAETSAAQVLPEVVTLLERLAFIIPIRELLLDLKRRNAGGEMLDLDVFFPADTQTALLAEDCWNPIPLYREATDAELMDLESSVAYFSERRLVYGEWLSNLSTTVTGKCRTLLIKAKGDFNEIVTLRGSNYLSVCEDGGKKKEGS